MATYSFQKLRQNANTFIFIEWLDQPNKVGKSTLKEVRDENPQRLTRESEDSPEQI